MKLLIIQPALPHYRVDFFNMLYEKLNCEMMVLYSGRKNNNVEDVPGKLIYKHSPHFSVSKINLGLYNPYFFYKYDVIICHYDITWPLNFLGYLFFKRKFIFWGIGLGNNDYVNYIKNIITSKTPLILYYKKNASDYKKRFRGRSNVFYAGNTVGFKKYSNDLDGHLQKENRILIVGSLDKRKSTKLLVTYFHQFIMNNKNTKTVMDIIGDGYEFIMIQEYVKEHGLEKNIIMHGRIEGDELYEFYARSLVSCSYSQAGLSILQSFFYGVPYVTCANAISGGETSVIENGKNGLLLDDSKKAWFDFFSSLNNNPDRYIDMGNHAKNDYTKRYSLENMVNVFLKVIKNENTHQL